MARSGLKSKGQLVQTTTSQAYYNSLIAYCSVLLLFSVIFLKLKCVLCWQ